MTKGITLNSSPGYYRFTSDCILNRRYDGETQFVDQYYFEGDLISSTPIPLDLSGPYAYTVLPDNTLVYVPDCEDGLHFQHLSADGTLLSDLPIPHSTDAIVPKVYFSDDGGVLCQYQVGTLINPPYSTVQTSRTLCSGARRSARPTLSSLSLRFSFCPIMKPF